MRRALALGLLCLLLLSGCRPSFSLPRATEPRSTALANVLGVDLNAQGGVTAYAATQGRDGAPPLTFQGEGNSLAGARLVTRDQGTQTVSYAHVEHIVVSERAAAEYLSELLSYSFQNGEQSMESRLWLLRDAPLDALFQDKPDTARRLAALETGGDAGTSLPGCTLRQAAAKLADDGMLLLPALRLENEELRFDGYALFRTGKLVDYAEGKLAHSLAVLGGASLYWTEKLETGTGGEGVIQLHSRGLSVRPTIEKGRLAGLSLTCQVDGQLLELWSAEEVTNLQSQVKSLVERELLQALTLLQRDQVDGADLRRKAGLSAPWHWDVIQKDWALRFPTLPISVTVKARISEST